MLRAYSVGYRGYSGYLWRPEMTLNEGQGHDEADPGCDNHHQPNQRAPDTSIFVLIRGAVVGTCRRLVLAVRHTRRPLVLFESSRGPTLPEPG